MQTSREPADVARLVEVADGLAEQRLVAFLGSTGSESCQSPPSPKVDTGAGYAAVCEGVRAGAAERPASVRFAGIMNSKPQNLRCPRQESNLRSRFRKPMLYPLSYGGVAEMACAGVEA